MIATFGLLAVIWGCAKRRSDAVPFALDQLSLQRQLEAIGDLRREATLDKTRT